MRAPGPRHDAGFTLIELLVVVTVIGVLSGIAVINLMGALDRSKQRATMADMRTISVGIEIYQVDKGFMPSAGNMIQLRSVLIPYQASVIPVVDRWGRPFVYTQDGFGYTLESYGKDGADGAAVTYDTRADTNLDLILSDGLFVFAPE